MTCSLELAASFPAAPSDLSREKRSAIPSLAGFADGLHLQPHGVRNAIFEAIS